MRLHHIGYVVPDISKYEMNLIHESKCGDVVDPVQDARLTLYEGFSEILLELIQPLSMHSFTWSFLQRNQGGAFHHLCYWVRDQDELQGYIHQYRLVHLVGPVPALLFDGREVIFFYTRNREVVEFIIG